MGLAPPTTPNPTLHTLHVIHLIHFTGSPHRLPLPRCFSAPPCPRRSCPPFQCPLPVSCTAGRWRDGRRMAVAVAKTHHHHRHHDRHHQCGFRRSCAGRALQVPRPLLRTRLRLFRDRKLGWMAILSQFLTLHLSYLLFICLVGTSHSPHCLPPYTPIPLSSFPKDKDKGRKSVHVVVMSLACQISWRYLV